MSNIIKNYKNILLRDGGLNWLGCAVTVYFEVGSSRDNQLYTYFHVIAPTLVSLNLQWCFLEQGASLPAEFIIPHYNEDYYLRKPSLLQLYTKFDCWLCMIDYRYNLSIWKQKTPTYQKLKDLIHVFLIRRRNLQ